MAVYRTSSSIQGRRGNRRAAFYLLPTGSSPVLAMTGAALAEVKNLIVRPPSSASRRSQCRRKERCLLHFVGRRADVIDTGIGTSSLTCCQPQLGVATRDHGAYLFAQDALALRQHLLGDTQLLHQLRREVGAAGDRCRRWIWRRAAPV